jgi:hypothetical protein
MAVIIAEGIDIGHWRIHELKRAQAWFKITAP